MPLTQEKPRFEISFTNNNDHNYLHKKFKKVASTVPLRDELHRENAPPIIEEDWSPGSESDTSIPPTLSASEIVCIALRLGQDSPRINERSSAEISSDQQQSATAAPSHPPISDSSKIKSIYKPKFHSRASIYHEGEQKYKKILSPNPNFLNEHISKIISDNEAIVDVVERPLQKKYGKIKQIAESKQLTDEHFVNTEFKSEPGPLNLSKCSSNENTLKRKRCHSESFANSDHQKHPLNPEGSIIKDLLLKTKNYTTGLLPVTSGIYDHKETYNTELIEMHRSQYSKIYRHNGISEPSLSPRELCKGYERENLFMRSNSINVTLPETQCISPLSGTVTLSPHIKITNKPENLVIKPESNEITPLPSPGPLLGKTRLVDSRIDNARMKPMSSAKRRLDSRSESFGVRMSEASYSQNKKVCFENNLRSLEELSQSPMRHSSTSLQMFGGEVKITNTSGSTTTLRIEPTRQLSPIVIPQAVSPNKHPVEAEASNIVRSGLHSGGTIVHNLQTPKDNNINSPHPKTPRIMLSIAASVPTPNLTVTSVPTPNIMHFQFPPYGAITAFNPLTLPPLSPSISPNGATTILHGGKLIPHVPGIPGPNSTAHIESNPGLVLRYKHSQNYDYNRPRSESPKKELQSKRLSLIQPRTKITQSYENQTTVKITSPITVVKDVVHSQTPTTPYKKGLPVPMPRCKIRHAEEKPNTPQPNYDEKTEDSCVKNIISEQTRHNIQKSPKPLDKTNIQSTKHSRVKIIESQEIRNFNFENIIAKSDIYNSGQQNKCSVQKETSLQEPLTISVHTTPRSETLYFQKNTHCKPENDEAKSRFLRPSSLPLKPGTFTPKKHHGITPNANTMPLISPETPRPAKAYGQLYLNGNAYTYLGLKCSAKVFYCTLNRPQPTYVPNQVSLSMYCNWQILLEQAPNPLGLSTLSLMALYDSRHRPQDVTIARSKPEQILTHSSQWKKDQENKQRFSTMDSRKFEDLKMTGEISSAKSKELAGGFESNEEYTYVRGRGRGRYVCGECGIRCKKPSMLKKHIRTHTDVRPYTCKHCSFSFKTKGNLTKHMKSKAHYKKCSELGINPNEGTDVDSGDLNQGYGETDDDTDSDMDDGNEGETESSDTDSWKSRLPEHEAAHCLLSLSVSRGCSAPAPGLLTSARPSTYPYTPTGNEETALLLATIGSDLDTTSEVDNEPMDLSKGETKSNTLSEIHTAKESTVLASLASNTAKLPVQPQWTNGEPMLHAYLTEKALQDTKMKASQFISCLSRNMNKQELSVSRNESTDILDCYDRQGKNVNTQPMQNYDGLNVAVTYSKSSGTETTASRSLNSVCVTTAELSPKPQTCDCSSPASNVDAPRLGTSTEVVTSTENAKLLASEYLKMAHGTVENFHPSGKSDQQDNNTKTNTNLSASGVEFKVDSKDYQTTGAYTPGRLTEDGRSVCVVCNKSFSKPSQLRLHINIHYMERPYRCSACAVSFRTRGHLQKHERSGSHHNKVSMTSTFGAATSSNPRPFRCSDCDIAFRIHGHLAKHLRSKMHVMRLECLSKLPFGTFAEIERAGVSLTDIDTTDCANSLASLQLLAQKLHEKDPTKLEAWDPTMVPPLLPAGGESSDDEDGALLVDTDIYDGVRENRELRTDAHIEAPLADSKCSATDT